MDIFLGLLLVGVFIGLNAFFVAAEFAIVKVRGAQLGELSKRNERQAKRLEQIISHLDAYLSTTQIGITFVSLALGWLGESVFMDLFAPVIFLVTRSEAVAHTIAAILGFIALTGLHILFGELLPKSISIINERSVALKVAGPLHFFYTMFMPIVKVLNAGLRGLLRILGLPTGLASEGATEEELRQVILDSAKRGVVTKSESDLIESVFEFSETTAQEIMVHRSDVVGIDLEGEPRELFRIIETEGFSRLPVFRNSMDEVLGMLYVKDLLPSFSQLERLTIPSQNAGEEFVKLIERLMRPPKFVSETQPISELLREFRRHRTMIGIVVSEHGGVEGIVTLEDILEELVGEIQDESDVPADEESVIEIGDAIYIDPSMNVTDFNERFVDKFPPVEENDDYQTISGYIQKASGKIPNVGDVIEADGLRFIVKRKIRHRLEQVKIEKLEVAKEAE
jgi:CBS domain containing-hemolysin-like protein